jgi:hypothetical protein
VTKLRKLPAQRADRAAVAFDVGTVGDQDMDEAADAVFGVFPIDLPPLQHGPRVGQPRADHGIQNLVLGFEVIVEIAARNPHRIGDVRERGVLVALPIEQPIGRFDDLIPGCLVAHDTRMRSWTLVLIYRTVVQTSQEPEKQGGPPVSGPLASGKRWSRGDISRGRESRRSP